MKNGFLFSHTMFNQSANLHKIQFFLSLFKKILVFFLFDLVNRVNKSFLLSLLSILLSLLMFI
jgi:hypothetical protein